MQSTALINKSLILPVTTKFLGEMQVRYYASLAEGDPSAPLRFAQGDTAFLMIEARYEPQAFQADPGSGKDSGKREDV